MTTPSTPSSDTGTARRRTPVQTAAAVFGVVFLVVGIAGFIPGITTDYGQLGFAMNSSGAMLLGLFQVSVLHNLVHLAFGLVGLIAARRASASRNYLIIGGIVYLVIFLYGILVPMDSSANFVPLNSADNVLHILLAVVMVLLGVLLGRRIARTPAAR